MYSPAGKPPARPKRQTPSKLRTHVDVVRSSMGQSPNTSPDHKFNRSRGSKHIQYSLYLHNIILHTNSSCIIIFYIKLYFISSLFLYSPDYCKF